MTSSRPSYLTTASSLCLVLLSVLLLPLVDASKRPKRPPRCEDPERLNSPRICEDGTVLWAWHPTNSSHLSKTEVTGRAIVYLVAMFYLFLGVSIVADKFMASIEVITSKEKEITYKNRNGEKVVTTVRIWNETVSNLTLMALGSSAPEIMLSVIEICFKGFEAGELGPSTIVGSASFNLFIIIALCMWVIPDDEERKVKHPRVFAVTAVWSVLAYFWLYFILATWTPGQVTVLEGVITLLFFPFLVIMAWVADRRLLVYKFMYKRYRTKGRSNIVVETEGGVEDDEDDTSNKFTNLQLEALENGSVRNESVDGDHANKFSDNTDDNRKVMVRIMRDLRKKYPDADMAEIAKMASHEVLNNQQKSRAFYRIQATRLMTGAGNIMNKSSKQDVINSADAIEDEVSDDDDEQAKICFDPTTYKVMENCGFCECQVVRKGGDLNRTVYVDYRTLDGTANAGSDYVNIEDTLIFRPGETNAFIQVEIMDDDIFEEDEFFRIELFNVRSHAPDGMYSDDTEELEPAILVAPVSATVVILDDDHAGVFSFPEPTLTVTEGVGVLKIEVQRNSGARGRISIPYRTVNGNARGGGIDYIDSVGELEFENDETSKHISVTIIDDEEYEKNKNFFLQLLSPRYLSGGDGNESGTDGSDSGINGREEEEPSSETTKILSEEEEEAKRIEELGKPRLGENHTVEVIIEESYEFKNTVDKLIKKANLAVIVGTSSWREQFVEALSVNGGEDEDDEDGEPSEPVFLDYVMHFLTVFWKLLFAFVPPTEYFGGWACFVVSIIGIGLLTAVIGDVASHFGCTINLNDEVTAVTLVAMGTSVPDTFASKVAAIGDQYADASIGNVTGSNAVNVFLGIGLAWTIAAVYWAIVGETEEEKKFLVEPGNLAFSVTLFSCFAFVAILILVIRRRMPSIGAELGGNPRAKKICSGIFVMLWFLYILLSSLQSYCVLPGLS